MNKGFTLVEVMIALAILLVGITGAIRLQLTGAAITTLSTDVTYGQNIAQTLLQKELSKDISTLWTTNSCDSSSGTINLLSNYSYTCTIHKNSVPTDSGNYTVGYDKDDAGPEIIGNSVTVVVAVTWTDQLGEAHSVYSVGMVTSK